MTKYCDECKQALTLAERWGIRKHVCDVDILNRIAYTKQEEHKRYLERKRIKQEMYRKAYSHTPTYTPAPVRSSSSSQRVSSSDDSYNYAVMNAFSPSYSSDSSSSYSSSCDSSSSSSDSGSCSSGD